MSPLLAVALTISGGMGGMHTPQTSMNPGFINGYPTQMMQMAQTPTNSFSSLFGSAMPNQAQMQHIGMPTSFQTQSLQQPPHLVQLPQTLGFMGSSRVLPQNFAPQLPQNIRGLENMQMPNTPQYPQELQVPSNSPIPPTPQTNVPTAVSNPDTSGDMASQIEADVLELTNAQRAQNGLPALTNNAILATTADLHSEDMLANNYFTHDDRNGCDPSCRLSNAGYQWQTVGENIHMMTGYNLDAAGAAQKIVTDWMNSPEHRANMLNASYRDIGIGVAVAGSTIYTTADFGRTR